MCLSKNDLDIIRNNGSSFVSFKFINGSGQLLSIDSLVQSNLRADFTIGNKTHRLKPFLSFEDPFRSHPTTSFLCEDLSSFPNHRQDLIKAEKQNNKSTSGLSRYISAKLLFCTSRLEKDCNASYMLCSQPIDQFADMRSDMVKTMYESGINVNSHYHGLGYEESIIAICGNNLVKLADDIVLGLYIIKNVAAGYGVLVDLEGKGNLSVDIFYQSSEKSQNDFSQSGEMAESKKHEFDIGHGGIFNPYINFLEYFKNI